MSNSLYLLQKLNELILLTHISKQNHFWVFFLTKKVFTGFAFTKLKSILQVLLIVHWFGIKNFLYSIANFFLDFIVFSSN